MCADECGESTDEFKCQRFGFLMERLWELCALDEVRSDEIKAGVKRKSRREGGRTKGVEALLMLATV